MPEIEIERYKARVELQRFASGGSTETRLNRVLELESPRLAHGIVVRVILSFSTFFDGWSGTPVVGFYSVSNPSAPLVAGWLPHREFEYYYDLVRNERPIFVFYEFRESGATSGYLRQIGLGTSREPVGEGPEDLSP